MHVHMRGGTQSEKEDWKSGSMSAIAGGVTTIVDQPNTIPPVSQPDIFYQRVREARENSHCNFAINSACTPDTPLEAMAEAGVLAFGEMFFAPSSYGDAIGDSALKEILRRVHTIGGLVTVHAEKVTTAPDTHLVSHDLVRSAEGELQAVESVRRLNTDGCRLHFCHISTKRSLEAVSGSVEVTPHHLFLSLEDFENNDPFGKVNPPLRTEKERKSLLSSWNKIDVIASDHAPHTRAEKMLEFSMAPSGISGVETMMPLLLAQVVDRKLSLQSVVQKTSYMPADVLGIPRAGFGVGDRADFALYPKIPRPVSAEMLHSKCGWTPFEGHMGLFPLTVIMGGKVVYREGEFFRSDPLWFYGKGYKKHTGPKNRQ
jgi:dihydroorotase